MNCVSTADSDKQFGNVTVLTVFQHPEKPARSRPAQVLPAVYKSATQRLGHALVSQCIGPLVARGTGVALDPVPFDAVSRRGHQTVQLLPEVHVLDRLFVSRAPALGLPAVDPLGDALAHVLAVQVAGHGAGPLED